jgi:aryl-alcohol dehydrogenase-like predicted oxidoreductase
MELRRLGGTDLLLSPLGLGTVKFGRNTQVKYPRPFRLPSENEVGDLLALARDLGINLLDTAPAYGLSQERIGRLLPGARSDWVICSKVGEQFDGARSHFDFSYATTVREVERSLVTLRTEYLDIVLIHSDGDDLRILQHEGAADALDDLKRRGLIRAHGMSTKTAAGGVAALARLDTVMATCNLEYDDDRPVFEAAQRQGRGVLVKKALMSGHLAGPQGVQSAFAHVRAQPAVASIILGTINPAHLRANVAAWMTLES